jgi:HD-GYP domain-containing protein (c-di-GMP phosphodiesterase class II)
MVPGPRLRLAELMASLSLVIDVALAQPLEQGLRTCLAARWLGAELGLDEVTLARTYYLALVRHIGCTAYDGEMLALLGDEMAFRSGVATLDWGRPGETVPYLLRHVWRTQPPARRPATTTHVLVQGPRVFAAAGRAVCEVAEMLATDLRLDERLRHGLGQVYERWDGRGMPGRARGDDIVLEVRTVHVAEAVALFAEAGRPTVDRVLQHRAGGAYDPVVAATARRELGGLLEELAAPDLWDRMLEAEPGPRPELAGTELTEGLAIMGRFADLKSPHTVRHSAGVADLAAEAATRARLATETAQTLAHAGLVHDLGRVGVSAAVWTKAGPLSLGDREQVRLHPYTTERVLCHAPYLRELGRLASTHHERLDGSGYHRGLPGDGLTSAARLLAAADAYAAMREDRPHRPALTTPRATRELLDEARAGRLDPVAVDAVLSAAGRPPRRRRAQLAGLTDRETEVLSLIAKGLSNRQVAEALTLAPKTVGHHVESIYAKIGVSTRAAATLYAVRHDVVPHQR